MRAHDNGGAVDGWYEVVVRQRDAMVSIEVSVSSAAYKEGLSRALFEAWPDTESFEDTTGREVKGPLPDWVVTTSTLIAITGGVAPTVQGLQMLLDAVRAVRHKHPEAPEARLVLKDGSTTDVLELESADAALLKHTIDRWLDEHTP